MGAVDVGGGRERKKKGSGIKKPKRKGFVLDMTPLVDIAFLLLTFFMFATTMSQPQMMEMQTPPDIITEIQVKASELLTLYVSKEGKLYYNTGQDPTMRKIDMKALKDFSIQRNTEKGNKLITVLKVDDKAKYETLVDVLDELNQAEGDLVDSYRQKDTKRERRFSLMPMEEADREAIANL